MFRICLYILVFIGAVYAVFAVGKYDGNNDNFRPKISSDTAIAAEAAAKIGGDFVLIQPFIFNKLNTAATADYNIVRITDSDIFLYNPFLSDNNLYDILTNKNKEHFKSIFGALHNDDLIKYSNDNNTYNPYFWLNVGLWIKSVSHIADIMVQTTPINEQIYRINEEHYLIKLLELDKYIKQRVSEIPEENRFIVTSRDSFRYFAEGYGFRTASLFNDNNKISYDDILRLSDYIIENNIKAVFNEASVPSRYLDVLQSTLEQVGYRIEIKGTLYSDILNGSTNNPKDYVNMMIHNIDTVVNALTNDTHNKDD